MKNLIVLLTLLLPLAIIAQEKGNKNEKASFEVSGNCEMCKMRIEKAAFKVKGVKMATWDVATHQLDLIYNEKKTDLTTIQQSIADVGHDTEAIKAKDEAYNSVHPCCKYRDTEIVDDHD